MDCIVHGVAKCWTQLSKFHFTSVQYPGSHKKCSGDGFIGRHDKCCLEITTEGSWFSSPAPKLYGLSWLSNPGSQPDFNLWWCIMKNKEGKPGDISETFVLPQLEEVVTWPHRSC